MDAPRGVRAVASANTGIGKHRGGSATGRIIAMEEDRNWFAGVDWVTEAHCVRVSDVHGRKIGEHSFPHSDVGLAERGGG